MKKILIVFANLLIMTVILIFVMLYANDTRSKREKEQITDFERTAASIERVTANYLDPLCCGVSQFCATTGSSLFVLS